MQQVVTLFSISTAILFAPAFEPVADKLQNKVRLNCFSLQCLLAPPSFSALVHLPCALPFLCPWHGGSHHQKPSRFTLILFPLRPQLVAQRKQVYPPMAHGRNGRSGSAVHSLPVDLCSYHAQAHGCCKPIRTKVLWHVEHAWVKSQYDNDSLTNGHRKATFLQMHLEQPIWFYSIQFSFPITVTCCYFITLSV